MRIKDLKEIINEEEQVKLVEFDTNGLGSIKFKGRYGSIPTYLLDKRVSRITIATELDSDDCIKIGGATVITYMFIYIL